MSSRNRPKNRKKRRVPRRSLQRRSEAPSRAMIVRGVRSFAPPRVITHLSYSKTGILTSAVTSIATQRLFPTNAYDVDPLFASTAMPGFTEWGALYRNFRTLRASIMVEFSNLEPRPVTVLLVPVNYDYGTTITQSGFSTLMSQPNCKTRMLSAVGGQDRAVLRSSARTNQFAGALSNSFDAYVGSTTNAFSPTQFWGFFYSAFVQGASSIPLGIGVTIKMDVEIEFFELQTPSS